MGSGSGGGGGIRRSATKDRAHSIPFLAMAMMEGLMRCCAALSTPCALRDRGEMVGASWGTPVALATASECAFSASLARSAHSCRQASIRTGEFHSRSFFPHPSPSMVRMVAMAWKWGFASSRWWQFQSTTMPRLVSFSTHRRARAILSSWSSSIGMAMSNSRATWASLRFSITSTEFHRVARSSIHAGASGGRLISEWSMPRFRV